MTTLEKKARQRIALYKHALSCGACLIRARRSFSCTCPIEASSWRIEIELCAKNPMSPFYTKA
jgi:hypothetical protein